MLVKKATYLPVLRVSKDLWHGQNLVADADNGKGSGQGKHTR